MLTLSPATRIYLAAGVTDMRKSFNTLAGLTRSALALNPASGHFFVFCNRKRNRLKILFWDGSGFWVLAKRLAKGRFSWPEEGRRKAVELRSEELSALLGGLDLEKTRPRDWLRHRGSEELHQSSAVETARKKLEESLLMPDDGC